jgi:hypothetical protein
MRRLSASLLILFAGTLTFAQTSSNPPTALKPIPNFTNGQIFGNSGRLTSNFGCPVGFSASRQAPGQIISAGDARQSGPAQGLHLTLDNRNTPAIESIEVRVYGAAQRGPYLPAGTQFTDTVSKTFELHRMSGSTSLSEADVSMHLIGSLSWADLVSITFTDGTTWHPIANFKCRAIPSNFLLVGSR